MTACLNLAQAETGNGAIDWFNTPIADLIEWVEAIEAMNKKKQRRKK